MEKRPIRVLFICTGNACRSQMAEALLRHIGGDRFEAHSAGYLPSFVFPETIKVLAEIGIDASGQRSKHWDVYRNGPRFDYVITLCDEAAATCSHFPGEGERFHWGVEDPAGAVGSEDERLAVFRRVRDRIAEKIRRFVDELSQAQPHGENRNDLPPGN